MDIRFLKLCIAVLPLMMSCKMEVVDEGTQPGKFWVKSSAGAIGYIGETPYYILDENGAPVIDGACICIPLHIVYLSYLDGLFGPNGPSDEAILVRNVISAYALYACKARADELGLDEGSDNCVSIVGSFGTATPYVLEDCEDDFSTDPPYPEGGINHYCEGLPGTYETGDGETAEPLSPLEDPSPHVSCSSSTSCEISEELLEYAQDNPGELMYTGAIVEYVSLTGGVGGYEFTDVPSGCLADELQFQEDDVLISINSYSLSNEANWPTIAASLVNATTASVTYLRNSTSQTLIVTLED